jgi:hypothetical protein
LGYEPKIITKSPVEIKWFYPWTNNRRMGRVAKTR